ncbi:MAG: protein kinase, partial [Gemmatimonadetes bacterium]|nr:protein kinase [Gemmatimonadota bacterium]NIQ55698.1 protein kinase [Gemmatimonadota bacterium]NIU75907.1 protein kinase [Gammaproteobacteria bacterium]NIX45528.1 protein kinase [Gemmatimonadota bacterium]
ENIMLRDDGYVKVLDFGLARLMEWTDGDGVSETTFEERPQSLTGTLLYMSPEQVGGERVGSPTDVWSLGVVLYELVTGAVPFQGSTAISVVASIMTAHPKPIRDDRPDVPRGL